MSKMLQKKKFHHHQALSIPVVLEVWSLDQQHHISWPRERNTYFPAQVQTTGQKLWDWRLGRGSFEEALYLCIPLGLFKSCTERELKYKTP